MVKLIGALFIMLSSIIFGMVWQEKYDRRLREIRYISHMLKWMEAEIIFRKLPLQMICEKIKQEAPPNYQSFFASLQHDLEQSKADLMTIWNENIDRFEKNWALKKEEKWLLKDIGHTLGKFNRVEQEKQFALTQLHLAEQEQEAFLEKQKVKQLGVRVSLLFGLMFVILLI
ncbi:stage III sporulation protein AB [Massilibacterium senegalense]|uniref:stage III sporulation protein AB n=1 Tax=Massilibacterium senegalense TaxID=1632858 RepID=UPI000781A116|nr:stage III sporulation protein AB [Massilibacterium senegalense]